MMTIGRYPAGTKTARVGDALHDAGTAGLTVTEIMAIAEVRPPSIVKEKLSVLQKDRLARKIAFRRAYPGAPDLEDVWACCCNRSHKEPSDGPRTVPYDKPGPIEPEFVERGRTHLEEARAAVAAAPDRRI